jgi:hypothetical protein
MELVQHELGRHTALLVVRAAYAENPLEALPGELRIRGGRRNHDDIRVVIVF